MAIEFKLPGLGENIDQGDIVAVLVKEGDVLIANQDVVEVEAGKGTFPIPCALAGRVTKVHVQPGQTVNVGAPLLTLEAATAAAPATAPAVAVPARPAPAQAAPVQTAPSPTASAATAVAPAPVGVAPSALEAAAGAPVAAGPAMRRLARELGVDLFRIAGTGPSGRIVRDDIVAAVRMSTSAPPGGGRQAAAPAGPGLRDAWGPIRQRPLPRIRKTIAQNMAISSSTIPHVTNFDDADITELERIRKGGMADRVGAEVKLTMMAFAMKAVAQSLRQHPLLNSSIDLDKGLIVEKEYVNLGVAVDTERGLVVPAIRNVDRLSIPQIAQELHNLANKARQNQFTLDDLRGATFTISNLGAIGGTYSTPIVNPPEVGILLVGRSRNMPVCVEDKIVPRLMMPLSLSYDHRLVDGAVAVRFLDEVKNYLQTPGRLLLAS